MKKTLSPFITFILFSSTTFAQNVGVGTNNPSNKLDVVSATDTAISAMVTLNAPLIPAIFGYSNSDNSNQIGILGKYNGTSGYGSAVVGIGYGGIMPPATKDIGLYGSQHSSGGRALYVDGLLQIVDGTEGVGKILTSDGTGTAAWKKPVTGQQAFSARYHGSSDAIDVLPNSTLLVPFDTEDYDVSSNFLNGVFTAPDTGVYHFDVTINWTLSSSSKDYYIESYLFATDAGNPFGKICNVSDETIPALSHTGEYTQHLSTDVQLNAGNTVVVYAFHTASSNQRIVGHAGFFSTPYSRFTGHRVF